MKKKAPKLLNQINEEKIFSAADKNFNNIAYEWFNINMFWLNHSYKVFKDIEKYLILTHLFSRIFETYSKYLVKLDIEDYFNKDKIEIEGFNISEISKKLNIPKESIRRKIIELEKSNIILRLKKKLIINRDAYQYQRPAKAIKKISSLLSNFSEILLKEDILKKKINSIIIDKYIRQNFIYCWKFFYEMHTHNLILWKNYLGDLKTFYIFGLCVINNVLEYKKKNSNDSNTKKRMPYFNLLANKKSTGINAMSISEISGIPRATVIRKLKLLVKKKILIVDNKKLYQVNGTKRHDDSIKVQTEVVRNLSVFVAKIFNEMRI